MFKMPPYSSLIGPPVLGHPMQLIGRTVLGGPMQLIERGISPLPMSEVSKRNQIYFI